MAIIYLVRHGRVSETPEDANDPELAAIGRDQARQLAADLDARLESPLPILTSPMRRCRETSAPLAELWRMPVQLESRVIEVPSPSHSVTGRRAWLNQLFESTWGEAEARAHPGQDGFGPILRAWREGVCEAILSIERDSVICSHFVPLNVVVGAALAQDRVICFRPDNASLTVVDNSEGRIRLIELGREMVTRVV